MILTGFRLGVWKWISIHSPDLGGHILSMTFNSIELTFINRYCLFFELWIRYFIFVTSLDEKIDKEKLFD